MDTIIFLVLLVGAVVAYLGMKAKIVIPIYFLGVFLALLLFHHHVTSKLNLSF